MAEILVHLNVVKKVHTQCLFSAGMYTGKQLMYRGKLVKSQKLHMCRILCFDLEGKTEHENTNIFLLGKRITVYTYLSFIAVHKSAIKMLSATNLSALLKV
jgi:hypothetical protein